MTVFLTVYIPFFVVSMYSYDWKPKVQRMVIGILFGVGCGDVDRICRCIEMDLESEYDVLLSEETRYNK